MLRIGGEQNEFVTGKSEFLSEGLIVAIVVIDRNPSGFGAIVQYAGAGLGTNRAVVNFISSSRGHGIDFEIEFYVDAMSGNDFVIGYATAESVLHFWWHLSVAPQEGVYVTGTVEYTGTRAIRKIEALDRNIYGTGGYVTDVTGGGLGGTNATIHFTSASKGGSINFAVNIWTEGDNDFSIGKFDQRMVLLHT